VFAHSLLPLGDLEEVGGLVWLVGCWWFLVLFLFVVVVEVEGWPRAARVWSWVATSPRVPRGFRDAPSPSWLALSVPDGLVPR
jgi:hypothetical protein